VLTELRVKNLLLIEEAELHPVEGLNVLTGETGAGKTVLAHALDLLLGGRPRSGIVRPGADEALVEGVFELDEQARAGLAGILDGDEGEVVLARRVQSGGRTRALINGRTATVSALREASELLLSFYGQHEHRKLTVASSQLEILDHFCGDGQRARLEACAESHGRVLAAEETLSTLRELEGGRERELDILTFEIAEIEEAAPEPGLEEELLATRSRLSSLEMLRVACATVVEALEPDDGEGAVARLAAAESALAEARGAASELEGAATRLGALALEAADVARDVRGFAETLEAEPGELEAVEARLASWERLKRKHGGTIEAVLEYAEQSRERRDLLAGSAEATEEAERELSQARSDREKAAASLRSARRKAATALSALVEARLEALAMPGASFEVVLGEREPGPRGADSAEFVVSPNPGVPAGPLREIASGGELSRVMLALLGVASDGSGATLIFDEVDAGIGGQTANAVGEQLVELSKGRQVICITHLPQVASLASRHFSIEKASSGDDTVTAVRQLGETEVVDEIVRMLGAEPGDPAAAEHARRMRNGTVSPEASAA